jgi:hypothetical protein
VEREIQFKTFAFADEKKFDEFTIFINRVVTFLYLNVASDLANLAIFITFSDFLESAVE